MAHDAKTGATAGVAGLRGARRGPDATPEALFPLVYEELRRLARRFLARERRDHTLQPTALVHEAYLRLVDQSKADGQGRTHFFALGARAMRRILIDHARARGREKRGGRRRRVTLAEAPPEARELDLDDLLALNAALDKLAAQDEREARVVELRVFGGLTLEEVADLLAVSRRTVDGDWAHARAWLKRELSPRGGA